MARARVPKRCITCRACVAISSMASKRPRLQCPRCKEMLSYSAYCRHQQLLSCNISSSVSSSESDSTFSIGSVESEPECAQDHSSDCRYHDDAQIQPISTESSSADSDTESNSDDGAEVWDISTSESDSESDAEGHIEVKKASDFHYVLCLFMLVFQLCYRLSDRGLRHILMFISKIIHWLSLLANASEYLTNIAKAIPRTLYSLQKFLKISNHLQRFVVCPKCHSLYDETKCVIEGPQRTKLSRKCDYVEFPNHPQRARRAKCGTALMKTIKVKGKYKL